MRNTKNNMSFWSIPFTARKIFFGIVTCAIVTVSCKHEPIRLPVVMYEDAVTDYDGNSYDAVVIGDQLWMASNLKSTHYADGTPIPAGNESDISDTLPYRYAPGGIEENVEAMGRLYNWAAVMHGSRHSNDAPSGVQGICPDGWHVPSNTEWRQLTDNIQNNEYYMEYSLSIGKALAAMSGWDSSRVYHSVGNDQRRNDATGFCAIPAGYFVFGSYSDIGQFAYFWTTMRSSLHFGAGRAIGYNTTEAAACESSLYYGLSVRCVKD